MGFGEVFIVMVALVYFAAPSAWKVNSQKLDFRFTEFSEVCSKNTLFGGYARPSTRSRLTSL